MHGAFLPVRSVTCNLCRDEVLIWCEMKVCSVILTTSLLVFVAYKSVGVLGCLQRCVGVKHDLVGMCAHLCVFLFVWRQYCSWICQKLCSYWQATSCLSMSHKEKHTYENTLLWSCLHIYLCFNCRHVLFTYIVFLSWPLTVLQYNFSSDLNTVDFIKWTRLTVFTQ